MELIEDAAGVRGREVIPRVLSIASPAAGAEWSVNVPGGVIWHVQSVTCSFQTSAVVANRGNKIEINDGSIKVARVPPFTFVAAGSFTVFNWFRGISSGYGGGVTLEMISGFPRIPILGGWTLKSATGNIDAADQYSAIVIYVLEVIEAPYDIELARDNAALRGQTSNAFPQIRIGDS